MPTSDDVKPKMRAWLGALASAGQDIENAFQQLRLLRNIEDATGLLLDDIGALVGQPRAGAEDEIYRRFIRGRVAANRSFGMVNELLNIAKLVAGENTAPVLERQGIATVVIRIDSVLLDDGVPEAVIAMLRDGAADGVRVIFEYLGTTPETAFGFDDADLGFDDATLGLGGAL